MPRGGPLRQISAKKAAQSDGPLWSTLTHVPFTTAARTAGTQLARERPRRPTADPVPREVRTAVHARSGGRCEICGIPLQAGWRSIQHRKRRSQGGPHDVTNLLDVCGPNASAGCHFRADAGMGRHSMGWQVAREFDPAVVPVLLADRRWVLLTADGGYEAAPMPP